LAALLWLRCFGCAALAALLWLRCFGCAPLTPDALPRLFYPAKGFPLPNDCNREFKGGKIIFSSTPQITLSS
jgi:hypothetical protein